MFKRMFVASRLVGVVCGILAGVAQIAHAQGYPAKPIRIIVPLGPGAPPDVSARLVGGKIAESIGQPVVVENRSGAGGTVGGRAAATATPDGYTLLMGSSSSLVFGPILFSNAGYSPTKSFSPISQVSNQPFIIAVPTSLMVESLAQFIALIKASPGKYNYATPQNGSPPHMSAELLSRATGISMVQVPFGSIPKGVLALVAGDAHLNIEVVPSFISQIRGGTIRPLATASAKRTPFLPDVPTAAEAGVPGFEVGSWSSVVGPAGLPAPIVTRLNQEILKAMATKEVQDGFTKQMAEITVSTPEELARHIAGEFAKWSKLIADAGIKAD
ncbi:MAG: Bug family tripartite tricarboxylate transporter substrate binding protein [Burkholderiales bacterium]